MLLMILHQHWFIREIRGITNIFKNEDIYKMMFLCKHLPQPSPPPPPPLKSPPLLSHSEKEGEFARATEQATHTEHIRRRQGPNYQSPVTAALQHRTDPS